MQQGILAKQGFWRLAAGCLLVLPATAAAQAVPAGQTSSVAARAALMALVKASDAGWAGLASLYVSPADTGNCRAGVLTDRAKMEMLAGLNKVRAIHALPPVSYAPVADHETTEAALMMAANGNLSHKPPAEWKCYSAVGARGAATSNLAGGVISPYLLWGTVTDDLAGWLRDANSSSIGHRRWLLGPFLRQISYGRADEVLLGGARTRAAALKVFGFASDMPSGEATLPDFVAYPFGTYPATMFGVNDLLSFTVVADKTSQFANGLVDFSKATVTVTDGAANLVVTDVKATGGFAGNGNSLEWRVQGLRRAVRYRVAIENVGQAPSAVYTYDFILEPGPEPDDK